MRHVYIPRRAGDWSMWGTNCNLNMHASGENPASPYVLYQPVRVFKLNSRANINAVPCFEEEGARPHASAQLLRRRWTPIYIHIFLTINR